MAVTPERKHQIMMAIGNIYSALSPENLTCDGEASNEHVVNTSRKLFSELATLEEELGRKVDETEANRYWMALIK